MKRGQNEVIRRESLIYAFAHTETWLEDYAKSHSLPFHELAAGVANLLQLQAGGTVLGAGHPVPALRGNRATRNSSSRPVEMAGSPHHQAQKSGVAHKSSKPHWTQLPENRARLQGIVKRMNRARLAKAGLGKK